MARCPACGAPDARRRFCGACGAALGDDAPGTNVDAPLEPTPEGDDDARVSLSSIGVRSGSTLALRVALGVASLAVVVGLASWALTGSGGPTTPSVSPDAGVSPRVRIGIPRPLIEPDAGDRPEAPRDAGAPAAPSSAGSPAVSPSVSPAIRPGPAAGSVVRPRPTPPPSPAPAPPPAPPPTSFDPDPEVYMASARQHVAHTYRAEIQRCFDATLATSPGVHGTIVVSMVPHADGRVASSRVVSDTTGQPAIGACIALAARSWTVPPPPPRTLEIQLRYRI